MVAFFSLLSIAGITVLILNPDEEAEGPWALYCYYPVVFVGFFVAFGLRQVLLRIILEAILFAFAAFLFLDRRGDRMGAAFNDRFAPAHYAFVGVDGQEKPAWLYGVKSNVRDFHLK